MRLQAKILLAAVPLALAAGVGTAVVSKKAVHSILVGQVGRRGIWTGRDLRAPALPGFQTQDENGLLAVLKSALERGAVYAIALDPAGRVLAHTNVAEKGKFYRDPALRPDVGVPSFREFRAGGAPGGSGAAGEAPVLDVIVPVRTSRSDPAEQFVLSGRKEEEGEVLLGFLRLGFPLKEAHETENLIFRNVLSAMGVIGGLALALVLLFLRRIVYPVQSLVEATGHLSRGDFGRQVPTTSDELGELSLQFNRMSRQLLDTTVSKDTLEARVQERTTQLTEANAHLTREMDEHAKAEEMLRQSQKMEAVGQLAGGVAHDFNNLLTVIMGYVKILMSSTPREDKRWEGLEQIDAAAARAAGLTRQLLAFSRKQVFQPRPVNLNEIVTGMDKMLRRLIDETIDLKTSLDPGLKVIKADPGQIEQVLLNLVVNARDAMPGGGRISLRTASVEATEPAGANGNGAMMGPGRHIRLEVEDTGCGMDAAVKARIFEPFFTTKEAGKGTGLGLSTVYGIVRQSGGTIEVESQPGSGTVFRIHFPQAEEASAEDARAPLSSTAGKGAILLVEDDPGVRALAKTILTTAGYLVLEADGPKKALDICEGFEGKIHLLLTDVIMPKMSGRGLAALVTQFRPNVRVLFVSGYTDDIIARHGVLEPGTAFLGKPFMPEALLVKVKEILKEDPPGTGPAEP